MEKEIENLKFQKEILLLVLVIVLIIVSSLLYKIEQVTREMMAVKEVQVVSNHVEEKEDVVISKDDDASFDANNAKLASSYKESFVYVSDGDVYFVDSELDEVFNLIDVDNADDARISEDGNWVAYTTTSTVTETIEYTEGDEREEEISKKSLYLADQRGGNSILVHDNIGYRWGWIPGESVLWYERAELSPGYVWGNYGNGEIHTYDAVDKVPRKIIDMNSSPYRIIWSPNGSKVVVIGPSPGEYNIPPRMSVVDVSSRVKTDLFDSPYVGGDRGGPPPLPKFQWSDDSQYIYALFSPKIFPHDQPETDLYKNEKVSALKISLDGSIEKLIEEDFEGGVFGEESWPPSLFINDFTRALYSTYDDERVYYLHDLQNNTRKKLNTFNFLPTNSYLSFLDKGVLVRDDIMYLFATDGNPYSKQNGEQMLQIIKYDLNTQEHQIVASAKNYSSYVHLVDFDFENEELLFSVESGLYRLSSNGLIKVVELDNWSDFSM